MLPRLAVPSLASILAGCVLLFPGCLQGTMASAQSADNNVPLDVRTGLYEMTIVATFRARLTDAAAAKMTSEQRRAATNFYAQTSKPSTQKSGFCAVPTDMRPSDYIFTTDGTCTRDLTISSKERFVTHLKCATGEETYKFERIDNEHFKGSVRIAAADGSNTMEQTREAKWLRDSCARTPPPAPAKAATASAGEAPAPAPAKAAAATPGGAPAPAQGPASAKPSLMTAQVVRRVNNYFSIVGNRGPAPMTAYAIAVLPWGQSKGRRHFYDGRMEGGRLVRPGGSVDQLLEPTIVANVAPIAAIFADGSTTGDAKQIADIMARRAYKLQALTAMTSILCDAERRGSNTQPAIAAIESSKTRQPAADTPMDGSLRDDAYTDIITRLKATGRPISIEEALQRIQAVGTPLLADPVKDPSGALYLKTGKAALFCSGTR